MYLYIKMNKDILSRVICYSLETNVCIIELFFTIYVQFLNNILHASAQLEMEQDIICDTQVIPQ